MKRSLLSAGLLLALAGCAAAPDAPGAGGSGNVHVPASGAPAVDLVGMWAVEDASGSGTAGSWLRLDGSEFMLGADCGVVLGSWRAANGLVVLGNWGALGGDCGTEPVDWLERVVGFDVVDDGTRVLTDRDGAEVVTLTATEAPAAPDGIDPALLAVPEVGDDVRDALAEPQPLAEDRAPWTGAAGRWSVPGTDGAAFVEFAADGAWTGSDGCNGNSGRWVADGAGTLLATAGPSTLMACDGAPVPSWLAAVTTAWTDGDELVLLDRDGGELGRLTPA